MRIGIRCREVSRKYGDAMYKKIAEYGFSCVDYGMMDTETEPYCLKSDEIHLKLLNEKQLVRVFITCQN